MDTPEFQGDEIADRLFADQFKGTPYLAVGALPEPVKDWILAHFPETTHVRFGPNGEIDGKMEWWINGYPAAVDSEIYRPAWKHTLLTRGQRP